MLGKQSKPRPPRPSRPSAKASLTQKAKHVERAFHPEVRVPYFPVLIPFVPILLLFVSAVLVWPSHGFSNELRRNMPFIRYMLMGDASVAVADEASTMLYNPAGFTRMKEDSIDILTIQFSADDDLTGVVKGEDTSSTYENWTYADMVDAIGTTLHMDLALRVPIITDIERGKAYGLGAEYLFDMEVVADGSLVALDLETFYDQILFTSFFAKIGGGLSVGANVKYINRIGLDKVLDAVTLYSSGEFDLENDSDYADMMGGEVVYGVFGFDVGLIWEMPFAESWQPRFGLAALNIGSYDRDEETWKGIEFGSRRTQSDPPLGGELPLNVTAGFAVSPTFGSVRTTIAFDMVDLANTAMEGDSRTNRTRLGVEIGVGPHEDGTALFSILFGWNATHFGGGVLARVWLWEIGFGKYTVERGTEPGEHPEDRRVLILGFRW